MSAFAAFYARYVVRCVGAGVQPVTQEATICALNWPSRIESRRNYTRRRYRRDTEP